MSQMDLKHLVVFALLTMVPGPVFAQGISNADFSSDLDGWNVITVGEPTQSGEVMAESGQALLLEHRSFLVTLRQQFLVPGNIATLSFDVFVDPGFDTTSDCIPDAFEASLLRLDNRSAVPAWKLEATSYFNIQTDGTVNLGPTTMFDGQTVTVDISGIPPGTPVSLVFDLIGPDDDTGSGIRIDNIVLTSANDPPVLAPIGDQTANEAAVLNVAISATDPNDDPITLIASNLPPFATFADNGDGTGTLTLAPGYTDAGVYPGVMVTARDSNGTTNSETFTITVLNVNRVPICEADAPDSTQCQGTATGLALDGGGSSDADNDALTYAWSSMCPGATFENASMANTTMTVDSSCACTISCDVTLVVDDGLDSDSCIKPVTIVDTSPPTITLNGEAPITLECSQATYTEQGAAVADTCDTNLVQATVGGAGVDVTTPGNYVVTYDATDTSRNPAAQVTRTVVVADSTAPVVEVPPMIQIWPPDHKYRSFTLANCVASVSDVCDGPLNVMQTGTILSIYSDEPEDAQGGGDGNTSQDIVILSPTSFKVRAERKGGGNGRVYGVTFRVLDEAGNATSAICRVGVPHDQAGALPVDDGPLGGYTVP